jgi:hypothetical protein
MMPILDALRTCDSINFGYEVKKLAEKGVMDAQNTLEAIAIAAERKKEHGVSGGVYKVFDAGTKSPETFLAALKNCKDISFGSIIKLVEESDWIPDSETTVEAIAVAVERKKEHGVSGGVYKVFDAGTKSPETFLAALKNCKDINFDGIIRLAEKSDWIPDSETTVEAIAIAAERKKEHGVSGGVYKVFDAGTKSPETFLAALKNCKDISFGSIIKLAEESDWTPDSETIVKAMDIAEERKGEHGVGKSIYKLFDVGEKTPETFLVALERCENISFASIIKLAEESDWAPDIATLAMAEDIANKRGFEKYAGRFEQKKLELMTVQQQSGFTSGL